MEFRIDCPEPGRLTVVYSGLLGFAELEASAREVLAAADERQCDRVLIDLRAARVGMRTMDIYDFAVGQARPEYARLKRALVVDHDVHHYTFFENVCRNIGHNVRVFDSITKAERWLAADNSTVRA